MIVELLMICFECYSECYVEGFIILYNDFVVVCQVLQMFYQLVEQCCKCLYDSVDDDCLLIFVVLYQGDVIGSVSFEQYLCICCSYSGSIGMGVVVVWQGKGVGSCLFGELLDIVDNWMNLCCVEFIVYIDNVLVLVLYCKFGFEIEGEMCDYVVWDGCFVDVYSMVCLWRVEGWVGE